MSFHVEEHSNLYPYEATMHFIVATDIEKVDEQTRKLIRSQVMKGKNKIKPRKPKTKRAAHDMQVPRAPLDRVVDPCRCSIPRKIGTGVSCAGLAEELDPVLYGNIVEFSSFIMGIIYPLGSYTQFDERDTTWFDSLSIDPAYLHITAFAADCLKDILVNREATNSKSTLHYLKGVRLLRQRLEQADGGIQITLSTVATVITLAITAHAKGESESARYHMEGVRKMVDLRGGLKAFRSSGPFCKKLSMEILRCDIGIALHSGSTSTYFGDPASEPFLLFPELDSFSEQYETIHKQRIDEDLHELDQGLLEIWGCMQRFCSLINSAAKKSSKLSPDTITYTLTSVMYPLLYMSFESISINEAIRLGLLCFCHSIFLQWENLRTPYQQFGHRFRDSLTHPELEGKIPADIMIWLLLVGGISVFNILEDEKLTGLLNEHMSICQVYTWDDLQKITTTIGWVGGMHDKLAKIIWDTILVP